MSACGDEVVAQKTDFSVSMLSYYVALCRLKSQIGVHTMTLFCAIHTYIVVITIDAIAHPEITAVRCNISSVEVLRYVGAEQRLSSTTPDTAIPKVCALLAALLDARVDPQRTVDGRKTSFEVP